MTNSGTEKLAATQLRHVNTTSIEKAARGVLAPAAWESMFGAAGDGLSCTDASNVAGWKDIELRRRVMVDVSSRSLATDVLGDRVSLPILLAPVGGLQRYHAQGEIAAAEAARAVDTVMCVSMSSSHDLAGIAEVGAKRWFQLYIMDDPRITELVLHEAERTGYSAVIVTVDNNSYRSLERAVDYTNLESEAQYRIFQGLDIDAPVTASNYLERKSLSFTWTDMSWLRSLTSLPIILKGIATAEDAVLAVEHGIDGIVISNHGGHSLGSGLGTARILDEVTSAVGGQLEVYADGGVRSGLDVLKALALGARAVLIGRLQAWALAVGGSRALCHLMQGLRDELLVAMGQCGVSGVMEVPPGLVHRPIQG